MKSNIKRGKNAIKRVIYKSRATKFKKLIAFMLVMGILASMAYFVKYAYVEYAVSRAHVVLNYPEIAESKYPDGSRFTYYDFTCDENLEEALKIMQSRGKYLNFTVNDIRDNFFIYSYLDGSAVSSVSTARSEGNDFSYVANEYKITFIQPHDYKNPSIVEKVFSPDDSKEFLQILIDVNKAKIARKLGGINGFKTITDASAVGNYDYTEEVNIYKTKINNIIAYLKELEKKQPGFVSEKYGLTLSDLSGKYNFLISNNLDGINNFVESSGISKDLNQTSNKINVNIENYTVKYNKSLSKVEINDYAMKNYDQTFTENLINVIQNDEYGLYQARPKTAFDTVSRQKHESNESVSEYNSKISIFSKELDIYDDVVMAPEEHERLIVKCDGLIDSFKKEYEELSALANEVVEEYYTSVNEEFISTNITPKELISKNLIVKMGIAFLLGVVFAFVIAVFAISIRDRRKINKKKKLIESIKTRNLAKEA
ncbi:MAG: hypothetical protein E7406_06130 [Ruminococcaceae bacterium]|nr:hypothetical protein [Oscillospiraceae bacterium]